MLQSVKSAISCLACARVRTILTAVSVAVGIFAVIAVASAGDYGTQKVSQELDSLGLSGIAVHANEEDRPVGITDEEIEVVRSLPYVKSAAAISANTCPIVYRSDKLESMVWEVSGSAADVISLELLYGRMTGDSDSGSRVCMVDTTVAQEIYQRDNIVGKTITVVQGSKKYEFEVVGVVEAGSGLLGSFMGSVVPSFVYIPSGVFEKKDEGSDQIIVKINENEDAQLCREGISRALEESQLYPDREYTATDLARQRSALSSIINTVSMVLTLVGGISLFVAGIGIMTVMTISVSERRREIGIKMAIGARRVRILLEFILEGLFISAIGCIAGTAMGYLLEYALSVFSDINITCSVSAIKTASLVAVAAGVVFSAFPAFKAASLDPVAALKTGD
ncbi:MAG: ABC transporter permease [Clostridia bacterium]|nr:ABC transporter permease [Clostridia bacterium]